MPVLTFGVSHHSAPVATRERLAFSKDTTTAALHLLMDQPGIEEAVILSTCNRTEIYTVSNEPEQIKDWLVDHYQLTDDDISPFCYHHQGLSTVRHLMRVASGLDSMIVGEPEIFGQVKDAFQQACDAGSVGAHLQQLFPTVFATSKHVRNATQIGRCPVSIAYAIVKICHQIFASLNDCRVLLIGAGTAIELVATHLVDTGIHSMHIANRTLNHAQQLATSFQATALPLDQLTTCLHDIDILISATQSSEILLKEHDIAPIMQQRAHRPILMIDLAVPRDLDPNIGNLSNTHLYNIDNLKDIVNHNMSHRHSAAVQAEAMIDLYAANYMRQLRIHEASNIIQYYRETITQQRDVELEKTLAELHAGKDPEAVLKNFAYQFTNKIMHQPTVRLRQAAADGEFSLLNFAKELFTL